MKLLLAATLGVALLTAIGGNGPLKDSVVALVGSRDSVLTLFGSRDEMARMRADLAELRSARGQAAPDWVARYAKALCGKDTAYVLGHTDESLGLTEDDINKQFESIHAKGMDCTDVRYLGSVDQRSFVFVMHQGTQDVWYVLTTADGAEAVVKIE